MLDGGERTFDFRKVRWRIGGCRRGQMFDAAGVAKRGC